MPRAKHTKKHLDSKGSRYRAFPLPAFVLCCFFLSGAAGLIYEVLWVRMIDKVIGSAPFAVATVLAVFMGGLALGSYLAGKYIDRILSKGSLLVLYGKLEIAVGVYGLLFPLLVVMAKPVYVLAYNRLFQYFWLYQIFTFLGCSLLLIIPTALMGATLPILCRFYVTHLDHLGARTGRLYGINTVGAAAGALLCGFLLINALGIWGTLGVAAGTNFLVGSLCVLLGRASTALALDKFAKNPGKKVPQKRQRPEPAPLETAHDPIITWALCIFAVSGFSAMAYEVIWTRLLGLIIGPTTYSFTLVIATFIIGLALGSLFFGRLGDRVKAAFPLLVGTQLGAACLALLVSQFLGNSQLFFAKLIYTFRDQFGEMILVQFMILFLILLGPTILLGATFPLVNRIYARSLPIIGKSIGTAYAVNTIGAILGSVAAGFVVIPFLGKETGLRLLMALQFAVALTAALCVIARTKGRARQWLSLSGVALLGLFLFPNLPSWNRELLSSGRYRNFEKMEDHILSTSWFDALYHGSRILAEYENMPEIVFYGDGIGGFTTVEKVTDSFGTVQYTLVNSGKPDASSHIDRLTQSLLAHVPLLFHRHPEKVMVLGLASGMTAGEVLHYPVKELDVLEINGQVVKACEIFEPWNNACLNDPRTRIIVQDGRNHLALTREKYDVIISEPSNPWMAGLANLYTLEFFETVKDHLRQPGIFVQWIHSYEMDWSTFALAGRTFTEVFPDGLLMGTLPGDYLLVGFAGQKGFNLDVAEANMKYAQRSANISLPNSKLLFHLVIAEDLKRLFGPGPLHTDSWPRLEFAAPKQLYGGWGPIRESIAQRRWLSRETMKIIEASNRIDALLDILEFEVTAYSPSPPFGALDLKDLAPLQKERYFRIVKEYCNRTFVPNYDVFTDHTLKVECAQCQAIKIRQHLALNPDHAQAYSSLGRALLVAGKPGEAIQALQRAVSLNTFDIHARSNLGLALAQQGRLEEAIQAFQGAISLNPFHTHALYNLALALARQGRLKEAIHYYSETLRIKPNFAEAHYDLGVALARQGRLQEAFDHLSEAVRIKPDYPQAHNDLSVLLRAMGQSSEKPKTGMRP